MDSSVFYRSVIRFMSDDENKYYSKDDLFSMSLGHGKMGPFIFACILSFTGVLAIPVIGFMFYDWLRTHRDFGDKLDQYFAQQGYIKKEEKEKILIKSNLSTNF